MTTITGVVRSYTAAVNRAHKSRDKAQRLRQKADAAALIRQSLSVAMAAATQAEEYAENIKSLHKEVPERIDWASMLAEPAPEPPAETHTNEQKAQSALDVFNPGIMGKLFGSKKKRQKLEENLAVAIANDQAGNSKARLEYQESKIEWTTLQNLAEGVLNSDKQVYLEVFKYLNPVESIPHIGHNFNLKFEPHYVVADVDVHSTEIVPKEIYSRTPTGKISKKPLSPAKAAQLYQDHVCSVALRSANEILAMLPVRFVLINALAELLDSSTGKVEKKVILSVVVFPETVAKLNMEALDPSDSMKNFLHHMKFNTTGFMAVEPIDPASIL